MVCFVLQLLILMDKNKTVPDIEKLQHYDFDLDVDEQQRLQTIGDAEVQRVSNQWQRQQQLLLCIK